jgi:hypothetical protein
VGEVGITACKFKFVFSVHTQGEESHFLIG